VLRACRRFGPVELIGCHGQTIYHEGGANTLQIGEAAVIAERTGVPVVSELPRARYRRRRQGAPLVPFVDYLLFRHRARTRIALNIGGIANITVIPAGARRGFRYRARQHGDRRAGARVFTGGRRTSTAAAASPRKAIVNRRCSTSCWPIRITAASRPRAPAANNTARNSWRG
jgi:1,6-anhydro-N-acetylmuramate kinase